MKKVLIKAPMVRKVSNEKKWQSEVHEWKIKDSNIIIEKTIEVDLHDYESIANNFFKYSMLIHDNLKYMWLDNDGWHVIAITCSEKSSTILIESEGYDYARYTSIVENEKLEKEGVEYEKADSKI